MGRFPDKQTLHARTPYTAHTGRHATSLYMTSCRARVLLTTAFVLVYVNKSFPQEMSRSGCTRILSTTGTPCTDGTHRSQEGPPETVNERVPLLVEHKSCFSRPILMVTQLQLPHLAQILSNEWHARSGGKNSVQCNTKKFLSLSMVMIEPCPEVIQVRY